ncbi:hypothetical protein FNF27_04580 [Cafeteria roenbergensis]|uniref:U3 small nucleolar RNA-associated protein 25 n=1 Tax=Cafeteria roenbergensis TaxID=33653 RepID=A0A5A8EBB7_CAFRO|nr:hypothetical protein FNF27_04580 [Cafeteria roenbergensis]
MFNGNIDDAFRVGLQVGRKRSKLYADFYASDIIVASPLGVRLAIAKAGGDDGGKAGAKDFLSSVEMVLVDGAQALLQQNWEHMEQLGRMLNCKPELSRGTDIGRVRLADLDGLARNRRQTIVLSDRADPDLTAWMRQQCAPERGWAEVRWLYRGAVGRVVPVLRQVFQRVPAPSLAAQADARLAFFQRVVLPRLRAAATREAGTQQYTLIIASSSLEYVRLRNLLDREDVEFAPISEHSDNKDVSRARGLFKQGAAPILLTNERWCHFNRITIKATRHVIFYGTPRLEATYVDALNSLAAAAAQDHAVSSLLLFDRYEAAHLERIVGSARLQSMLEQAPAEAAAASAKARLRAASKASAASTRSTFVFVNESD